MSLVSARLRPLPARGRRAALPRQPAGDALLGAFERHCRDRAHEAALWSRGEGERLTFGALAARVASWRRALELPAGEPLALAARGAGELIEAFLAAVERRIPLVLVDAGLPAADKLALCRRLGLPRLLHGDGRLPGTPLGTLRLLRLPAVAPAALPPATVLVKLTSGSTGEPVGACFTAAALAAGIAQIGQGMDLSARDRVLLAIPMSHSYGFDNGVLSLAVLGTPLVVEPSFYPAALVRALVEGEASFFPAVPPMVRALAETAWPSRLPRARLISAGGPLAPDVAARFRRRAGRPVHQFYGSTETGGICFERCPEEPQAEGTVGRPLPGVVVRLGPDGAVTVHSAANAQALLGQPPRRARALTLGDRAEWTADGRLRLLGRSADLLCVAGRKVSISALEAALRRLPAVADAAVVGVDDPLRGDRAVAFVVGLDCPPDPRQLPPGLAARDVRPLLALPYTARGKVDRAGLMRLAAGRR